MKTAYALAAWLIIVLGTLQIISAPTIFRGVSSSALWFAAGGLALVLTGVLNLLNRAYGRAAPGVRWSSRVANIIMAVFLATDGVIDNADVAPFMIVMLLMASAIALSFTTGAQVTASSIETQSTQGSET